MVPASDVPGTGRLNQKVEVRALLHLQDGKSAFHSAIGRHGDVPARG